MHRSSLARRALAGAMLATSLWAAPAAADKPEIIDDVRFDATFTEIDEFYTDTCGFPVAFSAKGRFRGTVYFDSDGEFKRFTGHPSFRQTLSSPWASITTDDRGLDKFSLNDDGTLTVFGTGIHLRIKGEIRAVGLWRLTIDPETGELLDAEYHGSFGLENPEIDPYICGRLGPPESI
jgi:hypothetical protein